MDWMSFLSMRAFAFKTKVSRNQKTDRRDYKTSVVDCIHALDNFLLFGKQRMHMETWTKYYIIILTPCDSVRKGLQNISQISKMTCWERATAWGRSGGRKRRRNDVSKDGRAQRSKRGNDVVLVTLVPCSTTHGLKLLHAPRLRSASLQIVVLQETLGSDGNATFTVPSWFNEQASVIVSGALSIEKWSSSASSIEHHLLISSPPYYQLAASTLKVLVRFSKWALLSYGGKRVKKDVQLNRLWAIGRRLALTLAWPAKSEKRKLSRGRLLSPRCTTGSPTSWIGPSSTLCARGNIEIARDIFPSAFGTDTLEDSGEGQSESVLAFRHSILTNNYFSDGRGPSFPNWEGGDRFRGHQA